MSRFSPAPFNGAVTEPTQTPEFVVPSYIGEDGQVLNLLMHEGAGDIVRDQSPFKNHGTIVGSEWADGRWGWGLNNVKANNDYVRVLDSPSLNPTTAVTMMMWGRVVSDGAGLEHRLISKNLQYACFIRPDQVPDRIYFDIYVLGVLNRTSQVDGLDWKNIWKLFGLTYDSVAGEKRIFIDGAQMGLPTPLLGNIDVTANPLDIGGVTAVSCFDGLEKFAVVYNVAKSPAFIRRFWESTRAIFGR